MVEDGSYDALVVDAASGVADDGTAVMHLELTILGGPHKGEIVAVSATGLRGTEIDLLGIPATLTVAGGTPSVRLEP
ncbi:MAG TPA: hypothetical protein VMT43_06105 [Acidimicrobiales bacterium]|nr:hypothetical protein [Acidimicrobiales bacterium]